MYAHEITPPPENRAAPKTILLVEDEFLIAFSEKTMLQKYGFTVLTAANCEAAVETALHTPELDLILMDINFGSSLDGTEAAQQILAQRELPIVFLSSHTEREVVEKTEKITAYGYVVKNSGETVLIASIKMAFKLFEAKQRLKQQGESLRTHQFELEQQNLELRAAQEELAISHQNYQELYDLAPVGYCTISQHSLILNANLTVATLLHVPRAALIKKPLTQFILTEDQDIYYRHRRALFETHSTGSGQAGQPQVCELRLLKNDGAEFWARLEGVLAQGDDGAPVCRVALSDITDRKHAEAQLNEHSRLLEEAVRQKQLEMEAVYEQLVRQEKLAFIGQIAGNIAHELRNPLGAVKQSVYYLNQLARAQQLTPDNPHVQRHLDLMDAELTTVNRVITDLLDITRLKPPQRVPNDGRMLLTEAITQAHLPEQVTVALTLTPDPFVVCADPLQLRQVLINLLINAAQAMSGAGEITIRATESSDPDATVLAITDTGSGVAPEMLPKLFEPLFTTKATGTGLGLSLCKQIIEQHQGRISIMSQSGQGTTVTIALPRE